MMKEGYIPKYSKIDNVLDAVSEIYDRVKYNRGVADYESRTPFMKTSGPAASRSRSRRKKKAYSTPFYKKVSTGNSDKTNFISEEIIPLVYLSGGGGGPYYEQHIKFGQLTSTVNTFFSISVGSILPYLQDVIAETQLFKNVRVNAILATVYQPLMTYTTNSAITTYSPIYLQFVSNSVTQSANYWDPFTATDSLECPAYSGAIASKLWKPNMQTVGTGAYMNYGEWFPSSQLGNINGNFQVCGGYNNTINPGVPHTVGYSPLNINGIVTAGYVKLSFYMQFGNQN